MDVGKQLKATVDNFVLMFKNPANAILFFTVGFLAWAVLGFFITIAIFLFSIRILQVPTDEVENVAKSEHHFVIKCVLLLNATVLLMFKYTLLPILYMVFWAINFFYNCFVFVVTLGESKWTDIIYLKNLQQTEVVEN
jgi:hypothetical protein